MFIPNIRLYNPVYLIVSYIYIELNQSKLKGIQIMAISRFLSETNMYFMLKRLLKTKFYNFRLYFSLFPKI